MKKKILLLTCGICGVLLVLSLILAAVPVIQAYNESGNLLILYSDADITAELETTGLPHSAEETEPGVWEVRSRHELIPMIHTLMQDKAEADPVYEAAQGDMFVLILTLWAVFTVVCLTVAFASKKYVRWTAFLLAFVGCFVCTMVLNEVVCKIPVAIDPSLTIPAVILTAVCVISAILFRRMKKG